MNRFFTRPELIDAYRLPKHVQEQLSPPGRRKDKPDVFSSVLQSRQIRV